jgi:hypothetical protein
MHRGRRPRRPGSTSACAAILAQQRRVRLLRLREDDRQPADDYFNYPSQLEN